MRNYLILSFLILAPASLMSCRKDQGTPRPAFQPVMRATRSVPEDMGRLVPDDAVVFARVSSPSGLEAKVKEVVRAFRPGAESMVDMDAMYGFWNLRGRDLEPGKPAGVALRMGQTGPQPILIVPARSPQDLADICEAPAVVSGSYVGVAKKAQPSLAETCSSLGNNLPVGDVAVRVRLDRVLAPLRPRIAYLLDPARFAQRNTGAPQDPVGMANLQLMAKWVRQATDHAKTLEATMSLNDGKLDLGCVFTVGQGSSLDAGPASEDRNLPHLAGAVPMPEAPLVYMMSGVAGFQAAFQPMYQSIAESLSDAEAQQLMALTGRYLEFFENMQDIVTAVDFTPAGIESVSVMQAKDTSRFEQDLEWFSQASRNTTRVEISGVDFKVFHVKVDSGRTPAARFTPALQQWLQPMKAVADRLFAKEGVTIGMGLCGKNVIVVMGNIQDLGSRTINAFREGKRYKLAVVDAAVKSLHLNPGFLLSVDLRRLARSIASALPDEVREHVPPEGPPTPFWFACAADGPVYEVQARADLAGIADLVRRMKTKPGKR